MKIGVTGGAGLVGRFVVEGALARGDQVCHLGRRLPAKGFFSGKVEHCPYALGDAPDLSGFDALVHCAFSHVPGRYRGGEGDDPQSFARKNLDGTVRLFQAAKACGVPRLFFLSSRAVYGSYPDGTTLSEDMEPRPTTLYGEVKHLAEQELAALTDNRFHGYALRATGIYGPAGPGQLHKWADLFADFTQGRSITPRKGTELHGQDLTNAIYTLMNAKPGPYNLSDITLDRHDLLAKVTQLTGSPHPLPARAQGAVSAMTTARLRSLGWRPGGLAKLHAELPNMV